MSEPWNCTGLIADLHTFQEKKKKKKRKYVNKYCPHSIGNLVLFFLRIPVSQRLHEVDTGFIMGESAAGDFKLHMFGAASYTAAMGKWSVCAPWRC